MDNIVLLLAIFACAAIFVGLVMTMRSRRPASTTGEDTLYQDGVIIAVLVPVVGLFWAARLFARDRLGYGLALVTISAAMWAVYLTAYWIVAQA